MAIEKENTFNVALLHRPTTWCAAVALGVAAASSPAQTPRPEPLPPVSGVSLAGLAPDEDLGDLQFEETYVPLRNGPRRRPTEDGKVMLGFRDVPVDETVPFIWKTTGKVVMPVRLSNLKNTRITVVNDEWLDPSDALDLLFEAFRLHGVGVVETDDVIILDSLAEIGSNGSLPVLNAEEDVLGRTDRASLVIKIFRAVNAEAAGIGERILEMFPDYATLTVDPNSNQIVVLGDIGLCQQVQKLINELDNTYVVPRTRTFRFAYADAAEIAQNITELFEETVTATARSTPARRRQQTARSRTTASTRRPSATGGVGPTVELRVTVNVQQNSLTVQAEPVVIDEITVLIEDHWDLPRPPGTSKVYALKYTDPLKLRDVLQTILGGGGTTGAGQGGQARGRAPAAGRAGVQQMVGGIYTFEAFPDSNSLIVLCKTEANFDFLDILIENLDQPSTIGLPMLIELKHANAVTLCEVLNIQLAEAGRGGGGMSIPDQGLRGRTGGSDAGRGTTTGTTGSGGREGTGPAGTMTFPWQNGQQREDQSPETQLIGKVRIVPVVRQNALSILAPPAYREALRDLVESYDQPARQVMISVIIAEVALTDAFSLGLRLSTFDIGSPERPDNAFLATGNFLGTESNVLSGLFDTSVLSVNFNINGFFQALAQKNRVRILQEPRIFTADNQEANFFDGRDIPFITDTTINSLGNPTDSFEYREVGVSLNVRPRITAHHHVDLEINLELSTISDERLFGGAILDRRETTTRVIVKSGQTIVLSGILRDEESEILRKVPLLGDIPLLGLLFQSRETETTRTELIAFITPYVVDNPDENDTNFNEAERQRLQDLSRPLDEQEDDLLDHERTRSRILPEPVDPASRHLLEPDELTDA